MFARYNKLHLICSSRCYSTFESLGISPATCQKLRSNFNISRPTLAQEQFIPTLIAGQQDLLLRDRTGTGKTFGTALTLASLIPSQVRQHKSVHSLYVVPNQELAYQIGNWIQQLSEGNNYRVFANTEVDYNRDVIPHTVVGTPGRILDLLERGKLPMHALERLILDEADQALSLPKRYATARQQHKRTTHPKPAERLLDQLMGQHQTMISSATLNRPLRYFLTKQKGWLKNPLFVDLVHGSQLSDDNTVKHHCLVISNDTIRNLTPKTQNEPQDASPRQDKMVDFDDMDDRMMESIAILQELEPVKNGILFVGPTISVASVKQKLKEQGIVAEDIKDYHTNKKKPDLWVATEFAARGVDIPGVSHVFILGKPASITSYVHMAGRTGRLGPEGFANGKVIHLVREHGWTESKMANMYELLNISVQEYEHVE
ncbi:proteasome component M29 [Mucor velutinosus]|uniref:RNA helicase n=1 Tax=Mucor velutinosus TaxID=708070 RepID=A0AAN7DGW6_9FUNG|nr:proteasome component M29 [Mucor velutinosus]